MLDNRLTTFISLVNTKSYTKTANELFISQPGVTHHIKSLENDFKCKLFKTVNKELKLTPAGELMFSFAQQQLNAYKQFEETLRCNGSEKQLLRFGTTESILEAYLNPVLLKWAEVNDNDTMDIRVASNIELFKLLEKGCVDFLITDAPFDKSKYESQMIKTDDIVLVVSKNHPLASKKKVNLKNIFNEHWYINNPNDATAQSLIHELLLQNITLDTIRHMSHIASDRMVIDMVKNNLGIGFLTKDFISHELEKGDLVEISVLDLKLEKDTNFVYLPSHLNKKRLLEIFDKLINIYYEIE